MSSASSRRARGRAEAEARRSPWPRWRTDLRLARRQLRRTLSGSVLVAALVALPVTALSGAAVLWTSEQPTAAQQATLQLGQAQSWVSPAGWGAGSGSEQYVDQPNSVVPSSATDSGTRTYVPLDADADPSAPGGVIPTGATVTPVANDASTVVETATGLGRVTVTVGDVWDPLFTGRYLRLDGTAPAAPDEAMVSPGLLDRLGARIGDEVVLHEGGQRFTITGTLRRADQDPSAQTLFLPPSALDAVDAQWTAWYVSDWQPDLAGLRALNDAGYIAYARGLVLDPPADAPVASRDQASGLFWGAMLVGTIAAVFGGYLTVLLSGAALSVTARRQQRTLAVAASVGAARGDVFRIVLLQGSLLGLVGGLAGAAAGIGIAATFLGVTDRGVADSILAGNWGFRVPWAIVGGIVLFAVLSGTIAALAPARAASRGDTIGALRGARRPGRVHARRPLWGLGLMITGLAAVTAGGITLTSVGPNDPDPVVVAVRIAALCAIVLGPVLLQIGVILAGHWLLTVVSRLLSRFGLAARLASRDAAANPSRVVPAFAAIAACVFLAAFALSATAISAAAVTRNYTSSTPIGTVSVSMWNADPADPSAMVPLAQDLLSPTAPRATALLYAPSYASYDPDTGAITTPDAPAFRAARATAHAGCTDPTCEGAFLQASGSIMVVDPDQAATALGVAADDPALDILRNGGAIVTDPDYLFDDGTAVIAQWRADDLDHLYDTSRAQAAVAPVTTLRIPATVDELTTTLSYQLLISPATAETLGIVAVPTQLIAAYDQLPGQDVLDRMQANADVIGGTASGMSVWAERGPAAVDPWLWLTVAAATILVIGASAVCLGLARFERRPDDATLSAIGGRRALRRRVNAWQALVIVGIGSVSGAAVGTLPMYGIVMGTSDDLHAADTPWPWLAGVALALPIAIAAVAWLVSPRRPDLTRRTVIA